ncbi:MAG: hypothetical protein QGH45_03450 [Myxococcota bacterium]|nr:hypothetical protein [Myxococcota bacterium]
MPLPAPIRLPLAALATGCCVLIGACRPAPVAVDTETASDGEVQAIIELGDGGGMPFLAEREVIAALYPTASGGELVVHAGSDLDRMALSLVLDLGDPDLPGAIDLSHHAVVLIQLDRAGEPGLLLDGIPQGTAEIHGRVEPGQEIAGSFNLLLPGTDEVGAPVVARIDGTLAAVISSPSF